MRPKVYNDPKGLTGWMVRLFIQDYQEIKSPEVRARYGYLGGWVSCIVNLVLSGVKLVLGLMTQSQALIADALHSAGDMLSSLIVVIGFKWAKKPRDKEHPFGHANAELIASLIMSVLLIVAGFELFRINAMDLWDGVHREIDVNWLTIAIVASTIVLKEWLFLISKKLGQTIGSHALDADAWHHRLDSLTTGLVVVTLVCNLFGIYWLDSVMGVVVSLVVIWSGVEIAMESISPLLGEMIDHDTLMEIREICLEHECVGNVHDVMVHKYGDCHYISLHMEILGRLDPIEMHDIAADAASKVSQRFNGECNIHVDPVEFDSLRYKKVARFLEKILEEWEELIDFHDLQFRQEEGVERVYWEFSVDPSYDEEAYDKLKKKLSDQIIAEIDGECSFTLEPGYYILKK